MGFLFGGGSMFKKKRIIGLLLIFIVLFSLSSILHAAETWLYSIGGFNTPHDISIAPDGSLYMTEPVTDKIMTLDQIGKVKGTMTMMHPVAFTVDSAGLMYFGLGKYSDRKPPYNRPGEVRVYDAVSDQVFLLGTGKGEFINPADIHIASDGRIYVADSEADLVKIYRADGSFDRSFGQSGIGDGTFNKPVALTVDDAIGEIYVADRNRVKDGLSGARIQVYDDAGNLIRAFGDYPLDGVMTASSLMSPTDMALFKGKLYVTDSFQNVVQVYDALTGSYLYALYDPDMDIRLPSSLDISPDGLLYVVSKNTGSVHVFGVDDYVAFSVNPDSLAFRVYEGMAADAQQVTIDNTGVGVLQWQVVRKDDWITVDQSAGTISGDASGTVNVGIDMAGVVPGAYAGEIVISSASGVERTVGVSLTVDPEPVLSVSDTALSFTSVLNGGDPLIQSIRVTLANAFQGTTWTATAAPSWLSINPVEAGVGTVDAIVSVSSAGLDVGTYDGIIEISSGGAIGPPATVTVTLDVIHAGVIRVTSNMAETTFTLKGSNGVTYSGSGMEWTEVNVPDGEYAVTFGDIPGYLTPISSTQTIAGGNLIEFNGNYTELIAESIVAALDNGRRRRSQPKVTVFDAGGTELNSFEVAGVQGGMDVAVGDVDKDGVKEIVIGTLKGSATVIVLSPTGTELDRFIALQTKTGVYVEMADMDSDGSPEIIATATDGSEIRVFAYNGTGYSDTGISIHAGTLPVTLAAGDVDGDKNIELVTVSAHTVAPSMIIWDVDIAAGTYSSVNVPLQTGTVIDIAVSDVDRDGVEDIMVATGRGVLQINRDGFVTGSVFNARGIRAVAAGDTNGDGIVDIVVGMTRGKVKVVSSDGTELVNMRVFRTKSGVRVDTGLSGY